jgi:SAM-dependent methyltransferase
MTMMSLNTYRKIIARFFRVIPPHKRGRIFSYLIATGADPSSPRDSLEFYLTLDNHIYMQETESAVAYGEGIHPKHRLTHYHEFFIRQIGPDERVLDIGCGNGLLAYDLVLKGTAHEVLGIDLNKESVIYAQDHFFHPRLSFVQGDALTDLPSVRYDVVILSNVLEHIKYRIQFLTLVHQKIQPKRYLIRVPLFERDWRVPLKKELGIEYRLDSTHETEYIQEEFQGELRLANLKPTYLEYRWGEIWCVAVPVMEQDL